MNWTFVTCWLAVALAWWTPHRIALVRARRRADAVRVLYRVGAPPRKE